MRNLTRTILTILLLIIAFEGWTQPEPLLTLKHNYYTAYFSPKQRIPRVVKYEVTKQMLSCPEGLARAGFKEDPLAGVITRLKDDYLYSGLTKGHNMSAESNSCDETGMAECFYYSNMTPQPQHFNGGVWKSLEIREREYANEYGKIIVYCGSLGKQKVIGANKVVVPKFMWKLIYFPTLHKYECFLFPNSTVTEQPFEQYHIKFEALQERTGIEFNGSRFKWSLN